VNKLVGVVGVLVVGLSVATPSASAQDDELSTLKARKLASPFLARVTWHLDYDLALADAARSGRLIFAYFTRSYAP